MTSYRYLMTDRDKRAMRAAFSHYVAPHLLAEIEKDPGRVKLGGDVRDVTVMFMDIRSFTPLSEQLPPDELVNFLNKMFADMTTLQLREFMLESDVLTPKAGEIVFRKDDYTNSFFSIVDGEVLVESIGKDGKLGHVSLKRGQFFGEMGLLSGRRRTATVKAGENCVLLETPRRAMLKLIASIDSVRRQIDDAWHCGNGRLPRLFASTRRTTRSRPGSGGTGSPNEAWSGSGACLRH